MATVRRLPVAIMDDAALARAAAAGDRSVAPLVWDRFSPLVRRVLRRSIGPGADVEDHVQEVFLRFFHEVHGLRELGKIESFLWGIAVRVARSELRRRRVRRWLRLTDDGALPEDAEAPGADADAREALARLYAILDETDWQSRLAFVLRHVEGLELERVAELLGVSLATAKRRLVKAQARVLAATARDPALRGYVEARAADTGGEP
jgi:RNA polymerase sigma-70 factor (ECF subfamily)